MAQKGTIGLLLIGGGAAVAYFTYQDLVNSQAAAQAAGAQAAASSPNWSLPGFSGQSPFTPGGLSGLANPPGAHQGTGQNQTQTTCPKGQVSVAASGGSTRRICVPANQQIRIGQRNACPPGQVWVPVGGGTTGMCYGGGSINIGRGQGQPYQPSYVSKQFSNRPCYFGFLFC